MIRIYLVLTLLTAAASGVWYYGHVQYREGKKDLLAEIEKARTASIEEKEKIEDEINQLTDDELFRRALKYVQPGSR